MHAHIKSGVGYYSLKCTCFTALLIAGSIADAESASAAEEDMVAKERAFLAARDNHRGIHNRLRELRGELDGVSSKYEREAAAANSALESARRLE